MCDSKSEADNDAAKLNRAGAIQKINMEGLSNYIDGSVPSLFAEEAPKNNKRIYESTLQKCKEHNPIGVKGAVFAMLSRTDTTKMLKKLSIPALLIAGAQDKLTTPQIMRKLSEIIPDSEFGIAPRAGHLAPLENAPFVNDMITGFLERKLKI